MVISLTFLFSVFLALILCVGVLLYVIAKNTKELSKPLFGKGEKYALSKSTRKLVGEMVMEEITITLEGKSLAECYEYYEKLNA